MFTSPGRMFVFLITLLAFSPAKAQSDKSFPGCEPPRELRLAMREQLDHKKFEGMKTYERLARRVEIIRALMEKFPREVYPVHDLIWYAWYGDLDLLPALQKDFQSREKANPSDPVAVYCPDTPVFGTTRQKPFESSNGRGIWHRIFHGHISRSRVSTGGVRREIRRR